MQGMGWVFSVLSKICFEHQWGFGWDFGQVKVKREPLPGAESKVMVPP